MWLYFYWTKKFTFLILKHFLYRFLFEIVGADTTIMADQWWGWTFIRSMTNVAYVDVVDLVVYNPRNHVKVEGSGEENRSYAVLAVPQISDNWPMTTRATFPQLTQCRLSAQGRHARQLPGPHEHIGPILIYVCCVQCLFFLISKSDFVWSANKINVCLILSTFTVLVIRVIM